MKRLIIIGASGLIGGHLYTAAVEQGKFKVIGTGCRRQVPGRVNFDMRREDLDVLVPDLGKGDVVCLLAAYSNPGWIFDHIEEAALLNVAATKRLLDLVAARGARTVFMSSVEVFDGEQGNYSEEATPAPLNLYGRMKREVEEYLQAKGGSHCIVRTGWNVGMRNDHRCVVSLTYETLLSPGARMAHDNFFSICDVRDTAAGLLLVCADDSMPVCHLAASPPVRRLDLAAMVKEFSQHGDRMAYKEAAFADIPYTEPRGRLNHLDCSLTIARYGLTFRHPEDIVRQKVRVLDEVGMIPGARG